MSRLGKKIWKITAASLATLVILLALGVAIFRIVEPMVPEYRHQAEQWAGAMLGLPVEIDRLDLRWAILGPEIMLQGIRLLDPESGNAIIAADEINVGVSLVAVAMGNPLEPRYITLVGPDIVINRSPQGRMSLAGWMLPEPDPQFDWRVQLRSVAKLGEIRIEDANVHWVDESKVLPAISATDLNVQFKSSGDMHELSGDFSLKNELHGDITFALIANGDAGTPETWQWQASLDAKNLPVAFFQQRFMPRKDGSIIGEFKTTLQASGSGSAVSLVTGDARIAKLQFVESSPGLFAVRRDAPKAKNLNTKFALILQDGDWNLEVEHLRIARGRRDPRATLLSARLSGEDKSLLTLRAETANTDLADVQSLAAWFIHPESEYSELTTLSLEGALTEMNLFVDLTDGLDRKWSVNGSFSDIGFEPWRNLPGIRNLGGSVTANQEKGEVRVETTDFHVYFPELFRGPLPANTLSAELNWESTPEHWQILLDRVEFENTDASVRGHGRINIPRAGCAPQVDIKAWLTDGNGRNKSTYLPVGIMQQPLIDWLDNALVAATVPNASLVLRGDLGNFPFADGDGDGLFEVRFRAEDSVLDYANGWPRIDNLNADVTFRNASMFIDGDSGEISGANIQQASATIENLGDAVLMVDGDVDGQVNNGLDFLRNSPLQERFGAYLEHTRSSGDMSVNLDMVLPIANISATTLNGSATLRGAELDIRELPRKIENIRGTLMFTENAVSAETLNAEFLGVPVDATVQPEMNSPSTRVTVVGNSNIGAVFENFQVPLAHYLQGKSAWVSTIFIPNRAEAGQFHVVFESELLGTTVTLPVPLNKEAELTNRLQVIVNFEDIDNILLEMDFEPDLMSRFRLHRDTDTWQMVGGHLAFGSNNEPSVDIDGISITGSIERFTLDEWTAIGDDKTQTTNGYIPDPINHVDLEIGTFNGYGQELADHRFQLSRGENEWLVRVQGEQVAGTILLPTEDEATNPIVLEMQRMHIVKPNVEEGVNPDDASPQDWPAFFLRIDDFKFNTMNLGAVDIEVEKIPSGLQMKSFSAQSDAFTMTADGRWEKLQGKNFSAVNFRLESTDVGTTLSQLGYAELVSAKRGKVNAGFTWNGPPFHEVLARADGKLSLDIEKVSWSMSTLARVNYSVCCPSPRYHAA